MFLLASPMLAILLKSGFDLSFNLTQGLGKAVPVPSETYRTFVVTLAVIQTLIATLAITNFHVQIINRLSSGYPIWYWWIANSLSSGDKSRKVASGIVVFMVMYASIQGGLFASFLPPA
jgi:phosphatidylinositol glycan class V